MEVVRYRNRCPHDLEHPSPSRSLFHTTTAIVSNTLGESKSVQTGEEEHVMGIDESQTYDIESDPQGISGTQMTDLSVRSSKRIPPPLEYVFTPRDIAIHN